MLFQSNRPLIANYYGRLVTAKPCAKRVTKKQNLTPLILEAMPAKLKLPENTVNEIVLAYQSGTPILTLSKQFGIGATTITRMLEQIGVHTAKLRPKSSNVNGQEGQIVQDYTDGMTSVQLIKKYRIDFNTIDKLLVRFGIEKRRLRTLEQIQTIVAEYNNGMSLSILRKRYEIDFKTLHKYLSDANIKARSLSESNRVYLIDETFLDIIDTEEKAYFMGFMYADGYNKESCGRVALNIHRKDIAILQRFLSILKSNHPIKTNKTTGTVFFEIGSNKLSKRLAELGCMQAKTFKLEFPDWVDESLVKHFIRGYVDGDGCIYHKGKHVRLDAVGTLKFTKALGDILAEKCSVKVNYTPLPNSPGITCMNIRGRKQVKRAVTFLYADSSIYLERKRERANILINSPENLYKKLYPVDVQQIRERLEKEESPLVICKDFNVHLATIYRIKNNQYHSIY